MSDLKTITSEQHGAVLRAMCPYCEYNIPETRANGFWTHHIPRTTFSAGCRANDYRNLRAQQLNEP